MITKVLILIWVICYFSWSLYYHNITKNSPKNIKELSKPTQVIFWIILIIPILTSFGVLIKLLFDYIIK